MQSEDINISVPFPPEYSNWTDEQRTIYIKGRSDGETNILKWYGSRIKPLVEKMDNDLLIARCAVIGLASALIFIFLRSL